MRDDFDGGLLTLAPRKALHSSVGNPLKEICHEFRSNLTCTGRAPPARVAPPDHDGDDSLRHRHCRRHRRCQCCRAARRRAERRREVRLQTDRGAHVLYRKIVAAAEQVCLPVISSSIRPSQAILQCRAQAIARAVTKINDPKLAAIHASASGNG
jgi:hypothetical protein